MNTTTSQHKHLLILASVSFIIVVALYCYMYYSANAGADRAITAHSIVKDEIDLEINAVDAIQLYQATVKERSRLPSLFIPADNIVLFIETLESLGTRTGGTVTVSSVDADKLEGVSVGTLGTAKAQVNVAGSWNEVIQTLMLAETLPYNVRIDKVRFDGQSGSKSGDKWSLSFDIKVSTISLSSNK